MIKVSLWICISCLIVWVIFVGAMSAIESPPPSEDWVIISAITIGIIIGSFALSYLGGHIIKRNKGAIRLGVLITVLWTIGSFVALEPYNRSWTVFLIGIIPVVFYWGIIWVILGFSSHKKT